MGDPRTACICCQVSASQPGLLPQGLLFHIPLQLVSQRVYCHLMAEGESQWHLQNGSVLSIPKEVCSHVTTPICSLHRGLQRERVTVTSEKYVWHGFWWTLNKLLLGAVLAVVEGSGLPPNPTRCVIRMAACSSFFLLHFLVSALLPSHNSSSVHTWPLGIHLGSAFCHAYCRSWHKDYE